MAQREDTTISDGIGRVPAGHGSNRGDGAGIHVPCELHVGEHNIVDIVHVGDTYRYIQIHTVHTGTYGCIRVHTGTYGYIRVHTGTYGYIRVHTGTYGYIQRHGYKPGHNFDISNDTQWNFALDIRDLAS